MSESTRPYSCRAEMCLCVLVRSIVFISVYSIVVCLCLCLFVRVRVVCVHYSNIFNFECTRAFLLLVTVFTRPCMYVSS